MSDTNDEALKERMDELEDRFDRIQQEIQNHQQQIEQKKQTLQQLHGQWKELNRIVNGEDAEDIDDAYEQTKQEVNEE